MKMHWLETQNAASMERHLGHLSAVTIPRRTVGPPFTTLQRANNQHFLEKNENKAQGSLGYIFLVL